MMRKITGLSITMMNLGMLLQLTQPGASVASPGAERSEGVAQTGVNGYDFIDLNRNGTKDLGEDKGLAGVEVRLRPVSGFSATQPYQLVAIYQ